MFETGSIWDVRLSISGGDDRRSFYLSAGYTANQGYVAGPNDTYDRTTITLRASQMLADRMQVSAKLSYVNTERQLRPAREQHRRHHARRASHAPRVQQPLLSGQHLPAASLVSLSRIPGRASLTTSRGFDNPFFVINDMTNTSSLQRFYGNLDLNWTPNDWLTLQWTPGLDYYTDARQEGWPFTTSCCPIGGAIQVDFTNFIVSSVFNAVAQHTFNPDFSGSLTLGGETNLSNFSQFLVRGHRPGRAAAAQASEHADRLSAGRRTSRRSTASPSSGRSPPTCTTSSTSRSPPE